MENLRQTLSQVNWDFTDYNSIKYPLDINSIPWYPATFPAPIPKFLIALLTQEGEAVLDPFGGKGTTCVEALKQKRIFYYNDLNPFAADITRAVVDSLHCCSRDPSVLEGVGVDGMELGRLRSKTYAHDIDITADTGKGDIWKLYPSDIRGRMEESRVSEESVWWYHVDTLIELLNIMEAAGLKKDGSDDMAKIRKLAFVTILKEVSSQRGHFTYVTDNCRPRKLHHYDAVSAYALMLERIKLSIGEFLKQDSLTNKEGGLAGQIDSSLIHKGDARSLGWIDGGSVDLVMTSPPYLCAQDYIKTMRLYNFFFPDDGFDRLPADEIGARSKRKGRSGEVVNKFYEDLQMVFGEVHRVLKNGKFFCLVIGQGKGKITQGYDTVADLISRAEGCGFKIVFRTKRKISYKSVRIGGVDTENIVIFQK